ncbi:MAG: NAD(+)/NADH kinase, partial [Erysipelotrichaceae bacterium]|nr:NAD(+)/NADH kinase [Erysipelotrichaceae bacterium]
MKLFFYPNTSEDRYLPKTMNAIAVLEAKGYDCSLTADDSMKVFHDRDHARFSIEESDLIVSLGGDGTLLRAAQEAIRYDLPLSGINCGRYGNLCAYRLNEIDSFDPAILNENKAILLETVIDDQDYLAVNDIVIGKDFFGGTIDLETCINDKPAFRFIGDGLIVSTPVGSTGYNRSAKGTILDYAEDKYVVTAICPHNVELESTVLNHNKKVNVTLMNKKYGASIYIDGIY